MNKIISRDKLSRREKKSYLKFMQTYLKCKHFKHPSSLLLERAVQHCMLNIPFYTPHRKKNLESMPTVPREMFVSEHLSFMPWGGGE